MPETINIVQYNILCGKLATQDFYDECKPADLEPNTRLARITSKLAEFIVNRAIICLQEVPQTWLGPLHDFFSESGYTLITSLYGHAANDYMGIAIAYPMDRFKSEKTSVIHVGNTIPLSKKVEYSFVQMFVNYFVKMLILLICALTYPLGSLFEKNKKWFDEYGKPEFDEWVYANKRPNTMILTTLIDCKSVGRVVIVTYHMPCAFWAPKVITLHTVEMMKIAQKYSAADPLIIAADCNFNPQSYQYRILTSGHIKGGNEYPDVSKLDHQNWDCQIAPMKSAYKTVNGKEPAATNQTKTGRSKKLFRATLDFIWYSGPCEPISVLPIPDLPPNVILPNEEEPSDHVLLQAQFTLGNTSDRPQCNSSVLNLNLG